MAPVQRALADLPETQVRVIFAGGISKARLDLGWSVPDLGRAETHTISGNVEMLTKLAKSSVGVNLIGGLGGAFNTCVLRNLPREANDITGLLLERGIFLGSLKDRLRPWYHRSLLFSNRARFDLILAYGSLGVDYYRSLGVPAAKIFPFQYQCASGHSTGPVPAGRPARLIYVGGLTYRKGADLLPEALHQLKKYDWNLTIVGAGPMEHQMKELFQQGGIEGRTHWLGEIASDRVASMLAESDLCIVPSRHDGWGMAVNEAIDAGLGAIATPTVGSKDLILNTQAGAVANDATAESLADVLRPFLHDAQRITLAKRAAVRTRDSFLGNAIAEYMIAVLRHIAGEGPAPLAPWKQAAARLASLDLQS